MTLPRISPVSAARVAAAAALLALASGPAAAQSRCPLRSPPAPTLTAGETVAGTLGPDDNTLEGDRFNGTDPCTGRPFHPFFYEAKAGERVTFVLESAGPDMTLTVANGYRYRGGVELGRGKARNGSVTVEVVSPTEARLLVQAESNVSRGRPGAYGPFRLRVLPSGAPPVTGEALREARAALPPGRISIRSGHGLMGTLRDDSPTMSDGSHFVDYVYQARAGETIVAHLSSTAFDPFLAVGLPGRGTALLQAETDDDGGGGTSAQVRYTAPRAGPVIIRANSLLPGMTGLFELRVSSQP